MDFEKKRYILNLQLRHTHKVETKKKHKEQTKQIGIENQICTIRKLGRNRT